MGSEGDVGRANSHIVVPCNPLFFRAIEPQIFLPYSIGVDFKSAPPVPSATAVAWWSVAAVRGEKKPRPLPRGLGERPGEIERGLLSKRAAPFMVSNPPKSDRLEAR